MKTNEIREMSVEELETKLAGLKDELFNLRFQMATGQLDNPMKIREVKNANDLKPSAPVHIMLKDLDGNIIPSTPGFNAILSKMAKAEWDDSLEGDLSVEAIYSGTLYIPSSELSNPEEEMKKLSAEKIRLEKELERSHKMLGNPGFVSKAPEAKINAEKEKLAAYEKQYQAIVDRISVLSK